ncbi:MAG: TerB family tellurite resistance protein [Rhodospirillales bacterium]
MTGFLANLINNWQDALERHRNRPFLEAAMAACAVIATDDGTVSFAERVRVDQILETLDQLNIYDPHEGVDIFNEYVDEIRKSPKDGHDDAMKAVEAFAGEPESASLLIRVCLAIAEADGQATLADQIEIVTLCSLLGVDPEGMGLYPDKPIEEWLRQSAVT